MPMLDAYIPAGALSPVAERTLMSQLTDLLLGHEGADPTDPRARAIAWVFLHRPAEVFVAGEQGGRTAVPVHRVGARGAVR